MDLLYTFAMNPNVQYVFPSNIEPIEFEHNYENDPTFSNKFIRYMNLDCQI